MTEIAVALSGDEVYRVTVEESGSQTAHHVTVTDG